MIDTARLKKTLVNHKFRSLLFPNVSTYLKIKTKDQLFTIQLSKECIEIIDNWEGTSDVVLSGDSTVLNEILYGHMKLQDAKELNSIIVEGSFRHQLMMEAILWFNQKLPLTSQ
jgi:ubiquinone biosynthesis protein UbiJ